VSDYVINTITSALFVGAMQPSQAGAGAVGTSYYADTLNCGTSIYHPKNSYGYIKNVKEKDEYFKNNDSKIYSKIEKAKKENNDSFEETIRFNSKYNRLILFDGANYHSSNVFNHENNDEEMLNLQSPTQISEENLNQTQDIQVNHDDHDDHDHHDHTVDLWKSIFNFINDKSTMFYIFLLLLIIIAMFIVFYFKNKKKNINITSTTTSI
jgi:hypothetical protein